MKNEELKFNPEYNGKTFGERADLSQAGGASVLIKNSLLSIGYSNKISGSRIGSDGTIETNKTLFVNNPLESTNFKKLIQEPNSGITIWLSNGTTPNGNLDGTKGDICLYCSATGQIAYNTDGGTSWTLL